jgi:hypothetical protein
MDDRVSAAADGMSPWAAAIVRDEVLKAQARRLRESGPPQPRDDVSADREPATVTAERMTVGAFAAAVGLSAHQAYRLLERGLVPGAFKTDPSSAKSRYYVPADAPQRFLGRGSVEEA